MPDFSKHIRYGVLLPTGGAVVPREFKFSAVGKLHVKVVRGQLVFTERDVSTPRVWSFHPYEKQALTAFVAALIRSKWDGVLVRAKSIATPQSYGWPSDVNLNDMISAALKDAVDPTVRGTA